jgi:serine phosphatase RsbU (regulator of sigma subunit)
VSRKILRPLKVLRRAARAVSETVRLRGNGDTDIEKVPALRARAMRELKQIQAIRTGDEIEDLADDLAVMTTRVLRYHRELEAEVAAKTAKIQEDLKLAREFQHALLPHEYPEVPTPGAQAPLRLEFAHFYQPSATMGGDFFDVMKLDDFRVVVMIADVMGHGTRSALVTAIVRALERNLSGTQRGPGEFLGELNRHFHEIVSRSGQTVFITAFLMMLDTREGKIQWAVAGHPAPIRARRGEEPRPLWEAVRRQPALGLLENAEYQTREDTLEPGDVFLLYTDGIVEAENPEGSEFGVGRLQEAVSLSLVRSLRELPHVVIDNLTRHVGAPHYEDDVCLVAVEAKIGN